MPREVILDKTDKDNPKNRLIFFCFTTQEFLTSKLVSPPFAAKQKDRELRSFVGFAEKGGFEPPVQLPVRQFSKLLV